MKLQFTEKAWEDYLYWQQSDKRILRKVKDLLQAISREPFAGIGKPEPLRHEYAGFWSRRITDEHRIVYRVENGVIQVVQARYHY